LLIGKAYHLHGHVKRCPPLEKPDGEREFTRGKIQPLPLLGDENEPRPCGVYPPLLMTADVFFFKVLAFQSRLETGEAFLANVCVRMIFIIKRVAEPKRFHTH